MTEIEFLILANHAEAQNGLLYLVGGGWTDHLRRVPVSGPPPISHFGIGVGVSVGWDDTNRPHHLTIRIETDDGRQVAKVDGEIVVGRPPQLKPGSDQRAVIAFNIDTQWPVAGGYRIVAFLSATPDEQKTVSFRVHDQPVQPMPLPPVLPAP